MSNLSCQNVQKSKKCFISIVICLLFPLVCFGNKEKLVDLTDRNFHKQTHDHEYFLVFYYTSWCDYCKKLYFPLKKVAENLYEDYPRLGVGRMECTGAGKGTCTKNGITKFPSLKIYHNGEFLKNYEAPRVSWHMIKFMRAQIRPSCLELKTVEEYRHFLTKQNDAILMGFFEEESKMKSVFHKLADDMKETMIFAHSSDGKLLRKEGIFDGIVLIRPIRFSNPYEEDRFLYKGRPVIGEIKIFISTHFHGLIGHRTPFNLGDFSSPLVTAYHSLNFEKNLKETFYWRHRMLKVAHKYRTIVNFAISHKEDFEKELREFGIDSDSENKLVIVAKTLDAKKYVMKEEFSPENLDKFVGDFLDSKLTPHVKSKPIPRNNKESVIMAVAANFEKIVINNNQDTLIQFYAPWSRESQKFSFVYKELGDLLKNEDIAIVKMDATENDLLPEFIIKEYPTLYWLPKNHKTQPVLYKNQKTLDELLKFIAKEATEELQGYTRKGQPKIVEKTEL